MLGLAAKEGFRDEKREIGVLDAGFFEHPIQNTLHFFPNRITVGLDYHATPHGRLLGQIGLHNEVVVPLGVIV